MKKVVPLLLLGALLSTSCEFLVTEIVTPNQCKRCKVLDVFSEVVWSDDECGGYRVNLETECKAAAYDWGDDAVCYCESYKEEDDG